MTDEATSTIPDPAITTPAPSTIATPAPSTIATPAPSTIAIPAPLPTPAISLGRVVIYHQPQNDEIIDRKADVVYLDEDGSVNLVAWDSMGQCFTVLGATQAEAYGEAGKWSWPKRV